jgi:predicted transcriptional regulator of viral defense system
MQKPYYSKIEKIFEDNNGIIERADIADIHYRHINKLLKDGIITRLKRGTYLWVDGMEKDELEILLKLIPDAILCMESALYYHGYTDRTPEYWTIAISRTINKNKLKIIYPPIKPYYVESDYLELGLSETYINEIKVRIYNKERSICDILKYANKLDREIVNKAIQSYVKDPKKNISLLLEYGNKLRVSKKIQTWLGVWL